MAGLVDARPDGSFIAALARLRLGGSGLYPVLTIAAAGLLYGSASLAGGSGFSAVFVRPAPR